MQGGTKIAIRMMRHNSGFTYEIHSLQALRCACEAVDLYIECVVTTLPWPPYRAVRSYENRTHLLLAGQQYLPTSNISGFLTRRNTLLLGTACGSLG